MIARTILCVSLFVALLPAQAATEPYELVIRGGRVVDGTGSPAAFADVAISGGRIVAIGRIPGKGLREITAVGRIVAPGFIDVHTHCEDILQEPLAENFLRMGVTTIVTGNCGGSALNVGRFLSNLEATNVAVNVATLIGHNTVRAHVMGGSFMRPPTVDELARMRSLVEKAMEEGAVGLSTGLIYLPGTFAKTEEIVELAKGAAAYDGIYASHMREEGRGIFTALDELFRIAREARIRAEVSHIKLSGNAAWGQTARVLGVIESARREGLDITQDQYVYTASSTGLSQLVPDEAREGGKFAERIASPELKTKIIEQMKNNLQRSGRSNYSYAVIAQFRPDKSLNGLSIPEAAQKTRGDASLDSQIETILEIERKGGGSGIFHGMSEADLQSFLQHPNTMFASDSGPRRFNEGVPHPRGYGNNARVLAHYVRELGLLRLEEAVRRMTSLPATTFRLPDRGQIRLGAFADLVIFDPEKVSDNSKFNDPHHYATGIDEVIVNGAITIEKGAHLGARNGRPVRRSAP